MRRRNENQSFWRVKRIIGQTERPNDVQQIKIWLAMNERRTSCLGLNEKGMRENGKITHWWASKNVGTWLKELWVAREGSQRQNQIN